MGKFVALLRGINVGARTKVPMAELRPLCEQLGWRDVATYIQSGNVVFDAAGEAAEHEAALERALESRFFATPVIVRAASEWPRLVESNPFPDAAEQEPNRLLLFLSKKPVAADAELGLQERAKAGERVKVEGGGVWIHFPEGSGTSKLSPSLIDRLIGSPSTSRNWRTVLKLEELARGLLQR